MKHLKLTLWILFVLGTYTFPTDTTSLPYPQNSFVIASTSPLFIANTLSLDFIVPTITSHSGKEDPVGPSTRADLPAIRFTTLLTNGPLCKAIIADTRTTKALSIVLYSGQRISLVQAFFHARGRCLSSIAYSDIKIPITVIFITAQVIQRLGRNFGHI